MIVVDANILIYSLIDFPKTPLAHALKLKDHDWRFPPLWEYEFGNAVIVMVRQNEISVQAARKVMEEARGSFTPCEMYANGEVALRLALERKLTFYDAQYLALAQTLGVSLITEDKGLQRAGAGVAISMEEFLN